MSLELPTTIVRVVRAAGLFSVSCVSVRSMVFPEGVPHAVSSFWGEPNWYEPHPGSGGAW